MGIKVRAIQTGYFGVQRFREGQVFEIPNEKAFSAVWMERLDKRTPRKDAKVEDAEEAEDTSKPTGDTDVI